MNDHTWLKTEVYGVSKTLSNLEALQKENRNVKIVCVDISDWEVTKEALERLPPMDGCVHSAGTGDQVCWNYVMIKCIDTFSIQRKYDRLREKADLRSTIFLKGVTTCIYLGLLWPSPHPTWPQNNVIVNLLMLWPNVLTLYPSQNLIFSFLQALFHDTSPDLLDK